MDVPHCRRWLSGFDLTDFTLLTSNFQNNLAGGSFSLLQQGNSLELLFTPLAANSSGGVPEPSSLMLLALGGLGLIEQAPKTRVV